MKRIGFYLVLGSILLMACVNQPKFSSINIGDKYSLDLPNFLSPTTDMHSQASLQYINEEKELYVLVVEEDKETMEVFDKDYDLESYYKQVVSTPFKDFIENGEISIPGRQQINGLYSLVTEIKGSAHGANVYYKLAIVETTNKFYQIVIWTLETKRSYHMETIDKILFSFKELPLPDSDS